MPSLLIVHYETTTGAYKIQKVGSTGIADLAITSALIAAGIIDAAHIANQGITSAKLTAALIASIEAGVADNAITSGKLASGAVIGDRIAFGAITSGHIGASVIGGIHILDGSIAGADIANQGLLSANYAAASIGGTHVANQGLLSANYGAALIATPHILNQGILSASIGAASIGGAHIAALGITSGKYAAQSINEADLASGISIDISEVAQEPSYRAAAGISSFLAVQFSASGYFNLAAANTLATMPALGLAAATILSGQVGTFQYTGRMTNAGWNFSGYEGDLLFLLSGGFLGRTPPALSGDCVQRMGKIIADTTVFVKPELQFVQLAE